MDKEAAEEMRKRAMENLSETKRRNKSEQGGTKQKVRKGGNATLEYLREKGEGEGRKRKNIKRRKYEIGERTHGIG